MESLHCSKGGVAYTPQTRSIAPRIDSLGLAVPEAQINLFCSRSLPILDRRHFGRPVHDHDFSNGSIVASL